MEFVYYRLVRDEDLRVGTVDVGEMVAARSAEEAMTLARPGFTLVRLLAPVEPERMVESAREQKRRTRIMSEDAYERSEVRGGDRELKALGVSGVIGPSRYRDVRGRRILSVDYRPGGAGGPYYVVRVAPTVKRPGEILFVTLLAEDLVDMSANVRERMLSALRDRRVDDVDRDEEGYYLMRVRGVGEVAFRFAEDGGCAIRSSPVRSAS